MKWTARLRAEQGSAGYESYGRFHWVLSIRLVDVGDRGNGVFLCR